MDPSIKLSQVQGIGPYFLHKLETLGIVTVGDLLFHFPFRYDDFSNLSNAMEAQEGEKVTLVGEIWQIQNIFTRGGKVLTKAVFNDGSGPIDLTWFNQSWLTKSLAAGDRVQVSGKISKYKNKISIMAPTWEKQTGIRTSDISHQTLDTVIVV